MRYLFFSLIIMFSIFGFDGADGVPVQQKRRSGGCTESVSKKQLTIVFLDVSGSFNKVQRGGFFNGKNYFDESCRDLINEIRKNVKRGGDCVVVKAIKSNSFGDDAFIAKLDLTDSDLFVFNEPFPKSDMHVKVWRNKKKKFDASADSLMNKYIEKTVNQINDFRSRYSGSGTSKTDLVNAFNSVHPVLEGNTYKEYAKLFLVYSDFNETSIRDVSGIAIDLSGVDVEGRFVSKNGYTSLEDYERNKSSWKSVLKCRSLIFKTPEETVN